MLCILFTSIAPLYFHLNCCFYIKTYRLVALDLKFVNYIENMMNTHATTVQYLEIMKIALYKKLLFRKLQLSSFIITLLKFLH
ncbi:hypothetical protein T4C_2182 [Trichinella pseudospiralis]|uniref:Uncharacterized protein n=1 Tax=Trichinella pseudospiralis TaxID=6337 RepID=A0A0V1INR2_TRIPS|nr:hypothetical protein T4C_388 [Trichinella pseudospiralis]KRZ24458.1 hypothetical protein T4C_2182 [Trichinella pseudospiralis]